MSNQSSHLVLSNEVRTARNERHPIVALELTVIAHDLPYPANIEDRAAASPIFQEGDAAAPGLSHSKKLNNDQREEPEQREQQWGPTFFPGVFPAKQTAVAV